MIWRVGHHEVVQRVVVRHDELRVLRHPSIFDPGVEIHPGVSRIVVVVAVVASVVWHRRVRYRRSDNRGDVFNRAHVVLGQLLGIHEYSRGIDRVVVLMVAVVIIVVVVVVLIAVRSRVRPRRNHTPVARRDRVDFSVN